MELINPRITVQNTKSDNWLVSMHHDVSDCESIDITLLLPRGLASVPRLQAQLLRRAADLMERMADNLESGTPGVQ